MCAGCQDTSGYWHSLARHGVWDAVYERIPPPHSYDMRCVDSSGMWHHYNATWTAWCMYVRLVGSQPRHVFRVPLLCALPTSRSLVREPAVHSVKVYCDCACDCSHHSTARCQDTSGTKHHGDTYQCDSSGTITSSPVQCATLLCPAAYQDTPAGAVVEFSRIEFWRAVSIREGT